MVNSTLQPEKHSSRLRGSFRTMAGGFRPPVLEEDGDILAAAEEEEENVERDAESFGIADETEGFPVLGS